MSWSRLRWPGRAAAWADQLASAAQLAPVLVHGDIHEGQLLADGVRLTGILDWETVRLDHPFWDLDLGAWGTGLWRRRALVSGAGAAGRWRAPGARAGDRG
jgi:aminoglycoside phosphotransferase (APT) family kinase protein